MARKRTIPIPRPSLYWKTFMGVALVALVAGAAGLAAGRAPMTWAVDVAAWLAVAGAGAALVARWVQAPTRQVLEWARRDVGGALRLHTGDIWETLAAALNDRHARAEHDIAAARSELEHLRAVLYTMADGVLVADAEGRIRMANHAAAALFGLTEPALTGRTIIECTMNAALDHAVHDALRTGRRQMVEMDVVFPEPRRIRAVISSGDPSRAAVAVLHDITSSLRVDQVRRDFVANVSHELRTPVTGIQTLTENLLDGALEDPETARAFLQHIHQSAQRLVALVDDLLHLARAESQRPPEQTAVRVGPVARAVVAALDPAVSEKNLDVGVDVPDDVVAWADPESLRQILSNLVQNAVKYTPPGGTVDVTAAAVDGRVSVRVADTGLGIAPEDQTRVFERFYRVDRARSRAAGGTGLGLSIVKHLVESLGGAIALESAPGQGSVFTVTLSAPPDANLPHALAGNQTHAP